MSKTRLAEGNGWFKVQQINCEQINSSTKWNFYQLYKTLFGQVKLVQWRCCFAYTDATGNLKRASMWMRWPDFLTMTIMTWEISSVSSSKIPRWNLDIMFHWLRRGMMRWWSSRKYVMLVFHVSDRLEVGYKHWGKLVDVFANCLIQYFYPFGIFWEIGIINFTLFSSCLISHYFQFSFRIREMFLWHIKQFCSMPAKLKVKGPAVCKSLKLMVWKRLMLYWRF